MGQQPSSAGKTRRKPKKVTTDGGGPPSSSLYDDDDDDRPPSAKLPSKVPSPTNLRRHPPSKDATPGLNPSPQPSPTSSPRDLSPSHKLPAAAAPAPPSTAGEVFTPDSANPFCAPLDHLREEERPFQHLASVSHFDVPTLRQLHSIFTDISASSTDDGIIDAVELTQAMGLDSDCLLARAIFRIFDVTQTKRINFRTWVTTLSALSSNATVEEKIRFSFSLYDLNDDGSIDLHELRSLLAAAVRENVLSLSEEQVQSFCDHTLKDVDRDGNGMVEYEEYRQVVMGSRKFIESFTMDVPALLESFRWRRGEVTEEEARIKRSRFKGRQEKEAPHGDSEEDLSIDAALAAEDAARRAALAKVPAARKASKADDGRAGVDLNTDHSTAHAAVELGV